MYLIDRLAKPVIYAHRGASKYAPENTMAAFELAASMGAPAIELDTMLTRDGIAVIMHDSNVDRTTNGSGMVNQLSIDEISRLDAGAWFSDKFKGEPVPGLRDVFAKFKNTLLINVELKNYHSPFDDLVEQVAALVQELDNLDSLIFSSFMPHNLLRLKKLLPKAKTALLVDEGVTGRILSSRLFSSISPDFIHPSRDYIDQEYLEREHANRRKVNAWTVNDHRQAKQFIEWGIDGLITDDPEGLIDLISTK